MHDVIDGKRVLVVEDDGLIALNLEDMLSDMGCTIAAVATSVAEALPIVARGEFDVGLLDLQLGEELALPIAQALRERGLPFVFATGNAGRPRGANFDNALVIEKPYRFDQLSAILTKALKALEDPRDSCSA